MKYTQRRWKEFCLPIQSLLYIVTKCTKYTKKNVKFTVNYLFRHNLLITRDILKDDYYFKHCA